jgi:acetyl-CoA C-acetyltransferase
MKTKVEIAGAGVAHPDSDRPSHAELLYRATRAALDDAGLEREAITTAVTSSYDYVEGRPLSNQFTLDSIGGVMKPCDLRLGDDGLHALAAGVSSALADPGAVVVVAAVQLRATDHSEESYRRVQELSYEPVWQRPIVAGASNPEALGFGLRAQQYMAQHGTSEDDLANLVSRRSAAGNGSRRDVDQILGSAVIAGPLRELHVAPPVDVAAALVISTDPPSGRSIGTISGIGWAAVDGAFGARDLALDEPTARAARDAYARAGVADPKQVDRVEAYNVYGIDELQAVEALGVAPAGGAVDALRPGESPAVNPTGGVQARGWAPGPASLAATADALAQMGNEPGTGVLVTQGWTGCGGCSAAVAVIETKGESR